MEMSQNLPRETFKTLNKIPIDDLSAVLHYLNGGAIIRLYQSGDALLRMKMKQRAVTTMILSDRKPNSVSRYPPCLSDFQGLTTLYLSRAHRENEFLPLCSGGRIAEEVRKLPKSLKSLSIKSYDSPLILLPPWIAMESFRSSDHKVQANLACSFVDHPDSLSNYLPNLETLELNSPGHFSLHEFHLPLLPPSLLSLKVTNEVFINLTSFEAFPRGLTRLSLGGSKPEISVTPASVATLPPNLTELMAYTPWDADSLQALPPSLTYLRTSTKKFGMRELASLPRELSACSFEVAFERAADLLVLPPRLTELKESNGDQHLDGTYSMTWNDRMLQNLPKTLTKLYVSSPVTLSNKNLKLVMPPLLTYWEVRSKLTADTRALSTLEGLTTLHLDGPTSFDNNIFSLPSTLQVLRVGDRWALAGSLPANLLMLGIRDLENLSSGARSLRSLNKLNTLAIGNEIDGKILEYLPPMLGFLSCSLNDNVLVGLEWLSKSSLLTLNLTIKDSLTPEITSLFPATLQKLVLEVGKEMPTKEAFAALPRNLIELEISGITSIEICKENILSQLPRGLRSLFIDLALHWRHFCDLPPSLDEFGLGPLLFSPVPKTDDELHQCFETLPRNLEIVPFESEEDPSLLLFYTRWLEFQKERNLAWMRSQ